MALQPRTIEPELINIVETPKEQVKYVLGEMRYLKVAERVKNLPNWSDWEGRTDEQKMDATKDMLSREVLDWMLRGDHRVLPLKDDELRVSYHNLITPFLEIYFRKFGRFQFEKIREGKLDPLIKELDAKGCLKPGIDLEDSLISVSASTGSTQTPWQYLQALKVLEDCRKVSKNARNWESMSSGIGQIIQRQEDNLWKVYGLERKGIGRDGVLMRSQSGTDSMLTNVLCGAAATAMMDEGATGGQLAASGRHPSKTPILGGDERKEEVIFGEVQKGWYPKLKGLEDFGDAYEFEFRRSDGELANKDQRHKRMEEWLGNKFAEIDQKVALAKEEQKYCPSRVMLSVTLGSKTNLGLNMDHLNEALHLREQYGEGEKQRVVIVIDASQGRLTPDQIQHLLGLGVIIDLTGSKTDEGPMFSALRYIPNSLVDIFQQETQGALDSNSDFLKGLGEYYTRGDMKSLLGDKLSREFPDILDIVSLLKWEGVVQTKLLEQQRGFREKAAFPGLIYDLRTSLVNKLKYCGKEKIDRKWVSKPINGHTWEVQVLDEVELHLDNPRMNTSVPFRILIDGKVQGEDVMKWLRDEMGNPGKDGSLVQIGQYVAKAEVDRFAYGSMTEMSLVEAYKRSDAHGFIEQLNDRLTQRLTEAMELKLSTLPLQIENKNISIFGWSLKDRMTWLKYGYALEQAVSNKLQQGSALNKLLESQEITRYIFQDPSIMPVVLMSGKSALNLDVTYRAWMDSWKTRLDNDAIIREQAIQAGKKDDLGDPLEIESLILAFVDHPFILKGKDGNQVKIDQSDYAVLVKSLNKYEHTQLCLWQVSPTLEKYLEENDLLKRCTIFSRLPQKVGLTKEEYFNPNWYRDYYGTSLEAIEEINKSYKTKPTVEMIKFFTNLAQSQKRRCLMVRGLGKRKERKDDKTQYLELGANGHYLGLHPLLYLTEEDVKDLTDRLDIPLNPLHWDHLKESTKAHKCGMDNVFVFEHVNEEKPKDMIDLF